MNRDDKKTKYDFSAIEQKWQKYWEDTNLYHAPEHPDKNNKFYMLVMFAYPSGDIHMGHFRNYIIGDAVARHQMMLGKDVLHPFGWDAFGLPAERAAIQRDIHPSDWTQNNIEISRATLQKVGISFDWSREVTSCLPDYYRWTQWMFIQLFRKGLAYRKRGMVNWCPEDKTVLANEQVVECKCDRCGTEVEKKEQVQWYFKITDYADRLVDDLDKLPGWPENVKAIQREWIGRSYGLEVDFIIEESGEQLPVFTTRPDTIYGVTFMAIAPESELLGRLKLEEPYASKVAEYKKRTAGRSDIERSAQSDDKDGVFTGKYAINQFSGEKVQLWVADYVLAGYGTGVVMGVPAHDSRDFAFARKYDIPMKVVIHPDETTTLDISTMEEAFTEYGPMVNSGQFDSIAGEEAITKVSDYAEEQGFGKRKTNYRLNDWSISRQRYWGCPIPIIHCEKCGEVEVPEADLPVELPKIKNYKPKGRSPLADVPEFMNTVCPSCGGEAKRDADTMDTFVCSSWYFLRYLSPQNESAPFDKNDAESWMPIDLYIGGISHATGHLLYFRFFTKFLRDIGWLNFDEPATRLFNHGMVCDCNGDIMSKSKGNVVSPISLMENRGIDITRMAMFFTAPSEREVHWSEAAITGTEKFVTSKLCPIIESYRGTNPDLKQYFNSGDLSPAEYEIYVKLNQTIKKVSDSIERLQFNTAIAALMELVRDYDPKAIKSDILNDQILLKIVQLVAPMAPHLAEELWSKAGFETSVFKSRWPEYDATAIVTSQIEIAVQINGKLRDTVMVESDADQETVETAAFASAKVKSHTDGKQVINKIYIKGRLLNILALPRLKHTLQEVDEAGRTLMLPTSPHLGSSSKEQLKYMLAKSVLDYWREQHDRPLQLAFLDLSCIAKRIDPGATVANRIKRFHSIVDKLIRFKKTVTLSNMQDIGGCRAVVDSVQSVKAIVSLCKKDIAKSVLTGESDYILRPKPLSGYRSHHLIFDFKSSDPTQYDCLKIELQIRTRLQHFWAATVETFDLLNNCSLKTGRGPDKWRRFFRCMSSYLALKEEPTTCANTNRKQLREELRRYSEKLNVEHELGFRPAMMELLTTGYEQDAYYYVLTSWAETDTAHCIPFTKGQKSKAFAKFAESEKAFPDGSTVLVGAESLQELQEAFPSYVHDTLAFMEEFREAIE